MAKQQSESKQVNRSRRKFVAGLGVGAAIVAGMALPFSGLLGKKPNQPAALLDEFPGPDSVFHPASDPRLDPRRKNV